MFLEASQTRTSLVCLSFLLFAGCTGSRESGSSADASIAEDAGSATPSADVGPSFARSAKGRVRFKRAERLRNDLAQALSLDPAEVCQELGQYDCADQVHTIALGGVEPYVLGIQRPLGETSATSPLAVERLVLNACIRRVDRDFQDPANGAIFLNLPVNEGRLGDISDPAVDNSMATLYRRALLRNPTPPEAEHLRQLYRDLLSDGMPQAARDWAVLTCFAVLTSLESLFY